MSCMDARMQRDFEVTYLVAIYLSINFKTELGLLLVIVFIKFRQVVQHLTHTSIEKEAVL
jgi:hypothetical protein